MTTGVDTGGSRNGRQPPGTRWLLPIVLAAVVVVPDQASKALIRGWLPGRPAGPRWDVFSDWLGLQYVENRGAAFGSLEGYGGLLTVIAVVVVVIALIAYARTSCPTAWLKSGVGLLVGGAVGNVIDRLVHGYVVDFVAVGPWPRFNVADSAITVGVLLLAWRLSGDEDTKAVRPTADVTSAAPGDHTSDERTPSAGTNGKQAER